MRKYNIFTIALLLFSMVGFVYAQGVIENPTIGDITTTNPITMKQQGTTPSNPISGYNKIYMKSDGLMYKLNSSGTEAGIASGTVVSSDLTEALKTPPAIGGTTPAAGTFTTINTTDNVTIGSTTAGKNLTVYGTALIGTSYVGASSAVKTSDYTVTTTDGYTTIFITCSSADVTITLPAASVKRNLRFARTDATAYRAIISPAGTDTISGGPLLELISQYQTTLLESDGTATWYVW